MLALRHILSCDKAPGTAAVLGGTVYVENRGGAGGLIATEYVAQGEHDGYTLLHGAIGTLVFIPSTRHVQYEVKRDFILSADLANPLVLVVNPKRGLKSVTDFVAYAKANPGKLSVASAGLGINTHMASELLSGKRGSTSFTLLIAAPARRCRICFLVKSMRRSLTWHSWRCKFSKAA